MGIFTLIGSAFSWLTGNSKSAESAVNAVINSGDALVFTEQEKDNSNHKKLDFIIEHAKATQSQSISRRVITAAVTFAFLFLLLVAAVAGYYDGNEVDTYSDFILTLLADVVLQPFSIILAFYFVTPILKRK